MKKLDVWKAIKEERESVFVIDSSLPTGMYLAAMNGKIRERGMACPDKLVCIKEKLNAE